MAEPSAAAQPVVAKRRRVEHSEQLEELCRQREWKRAEERAKSHPQEATPQHQRPQADSVESPLSLACREGAPKECIQAILQASPIRLRELDDLAETTPLHEAIICESTDARVIQLLLEYDEKMPGKRAALMQDVDGHTPLHLLIRRKLTIHVLSGTTADSDYKTILELLVKSCPEAVQVPDRGEYEEPPLVMALKAPVYAGADDESSEYVRVEKRIFEMVQCMLRYCPNAACKVLTGARGNYTAIHSAVFHGRCSDTIQLLLEAKRDESPLLLANTQGEIPLHFSCMRGESPRSIELLGEASPRAVLKRDVSGVTPLHWLWIRFVSTLLSLEEKGFNDDLVEVERDPEPSQSSKYTEFWRLERGDFNADLNLIKRLDPPVDFLRMRHISPELWGDQSHTWAERAVAALASVRERRLQQRQEDGGELQRPTLEWSRLESVTSLFWAKVVALLRVAAKTLPGHGDHEFKLVHTAMATPSCPPQIARMVCLNFPEELLQIDHQGKLPLHHAASRQWHAWDHRPNHGSPEPESAAGRLLQGESLSLFQIALDLSPPQACRITDHDGKLVLHHAIDTFVSACASRRIDTAHVEGMLEIIRKLLKLNPGFWERRDAETKLYPCLQAASVATKQDPPSASYHHFESPNENTVSFVYLLLRENPSLVMLGLKENTND